MNADTQDNYSIKQLANLLATSKSQIVRGLRGCHFIETTSRGGRCKKYAFHDLPDELRSAIIAKKLSAPESLIAPKARSFEHTTILLQKWEAALQWNRDLAVLRKNLLDALCVFANAEGLPITQAEWKFAELYNKRSAHGIPATYYERVKTTSAPNLDLWRRKFEKDGLPGLLSEFGKRRGRFFAITPEMRIFIVAQLALNPDIRVQRLYEMLCKEFSGSKIPDRTTIANYLRNEWRGKGARNEELHILRKNPQEWRNKFLPAFGSRTAAARFFCDVWELDSTINDVILGDIRYALIFNIDVYSRRLKIARQPTSTSIGVAACVREGLLDWGVPVCCRKDNGRDYASDHLVAVFSSLGIETPPLPPYAPDRKGCVERVIRTFNHHVAELLPGFCGHSVAERQALRERGQWLKKLQTPGEPVRLPLTCKQFDAITRAFIDKYERTPHRSLGGKTPFQASIESKRQPAKIRDERALDILLAPVAIRTVQKRGIELDGGFYTSPELVDHIGKRVHLRRDLADAGIVFVFELLDEAQRSARFLCKAYDAALSGENLTEYIAAKNRKSKAQREKSRALNTLSRTTPEPYTILLDQGEITEERPNVLPFQAEADSPAIREAHKAVDDQRQQGTVPLTICCKVIESEARFKRTDKNSKWDKYPEELLDNPIRLLDWFEEKREAVGLSPDEQEHVRHLKREFPRQYEAWEDMQKEKVALAVPPSQIP